MKSLLILFLLINVISLFTSNGTINHSEIFISTNNPFINMGKDTFKEIESNNSTFENRDATVSGTVTYNGIFTISFICLCIYDFSDESITNFILPGSGEFSEVLDTGDYYIYAFAGYTEDEINLAYGIYNSCLYPEIIHLDEGQILDSLNIEMFDYAPLYLTRFKNSATFGATVVFPLETLHPPFNILEEMYLYTENDSVKMYGAKLTGFIGSGLIEEIFFEEDAYWCPSQMSINDIWTTVFVGRDIQFQPVAYYAPMEVISDQIVLINGSEETSYITESIDDNSNLIKKWFVSEYGIIKEKKIMFYENIPYTHMNLEIFDFNIEGGSGMMPVDENNRWVYSVIFKEHPTDLIAIYQENSVVLKWDPPYGQEPENRDEINWLGYHIYEDGVLYQTIAATETEFIISSPDNTHEYYVTAFNDLGDTEPSNTVTVTWTNTVELTCGKISDLYKNYPNPFNPETTIYFSLAKNTENTKIELCNIKGQKVKTLVNTKLKAGSYSVVWNGDNETGEKVSSGVYLYKLKINGESIAIRKCLLLK